MADVANDFTDGTTGEAYEVNQNFKDCSGWIKSIVHTTTYNSEQIIKFSDSIWQTEQIRTTDSGSNWVAGGFGLNYLADTFTGGYGIALANSGGSANYTSDSGATWTAATTSPANCTKINAVYLVSATIGIAVGEAPSGADSWYTTDGGDNWTQSTTGPTSITHSCAMCSTTIGYAVDTNNNIWKTTDGGDNWTDTTHQSPRDIFQVFPIDTDTVLLLNHVDTGRLGITKYVNSTNTQTTLFYAEGIASADVDTSNIVEYGNYYYFVGFWYSAILVRINTSTNEVHSKPLGLKSGDLSVSAYAHGSYLIEAGGKLYINILGRIEEIDV